MKSKLLVFRGEPGTGKSTLAKLLCDKLGWTLIVRDDIKEDLVKKGTDESKLGAQSYLLMWQEAKKLLAKGQSCICDTNLFQPITVADLAAFEEKAKILIIECFVSNKRVHKQRLESRRDQKLAEFWIDNWQKYKNYLKDAKNNEALDINIHYPLLRVDTVKRIKINDILNWIQQID